MINPFRFLDSPVSRAAHASLLYARPAPAAPPLAAGAGLEWLGDYDWHPEHRYAERMDDGDLPDVPDFARIDTDRDYPRDDFVPSTISFADPAPP